MLKKLFKLDFLWINKFAPYFLGGALILALASRLTLNLTSIAGIIFHNTFQSLAISATVGLVCNVFARTIVRFKNSLIKDESYLLRTLPVTPATHWHSRALSFLASTIFCVLSILTVLALLFLDHDLWQTIATLAQENTPALIFLVLTIFAETTTLGFSIFTSTLLGRRAQTQRNLKTALYALLFYWGAQLLLLGSAFLLGQLFPSLKAIFAATDDMSFLDVTKTFQNFFIFSGTFYTLCSVALYFLGSHTLQKGIDVE